MMVERSPYVENVGKLLKDLDQAATKINEFSQKQEQTISKQEINDLIKAIRHFNVTLDESYWEDKKLAPEGMSVAIEKALKAIQLFQLNQPEKNKTIQKNVDQAVVSLFSALTKEMNAFDKNLRDIKKYKIGRKVEGINKSKTSQ